MKRLIKILILLAIFTFNIKIAISQESKSIQLIDMVTSQPIANAGFIYGNRSGVSDQLGKIGIIFSENTELQLSHINYGKWTLASLEVVRAINTGKILRESSSINLQPVSIIAYHTGNETGKINLNIQDKLNHDAGAVLNTDVSINSIKKSGVYGFDPGSSWV